VNCVKCARELDCLYVKLFQKARESSRLVVEAQNARGQALDALFRAAEEMQELSQSFNVQYLTLQQDMQRENRQFTWSATS